MNGSSLADGFLTFLVVTLFMAFHWFGIKWTHQVPADIVFNAKMKRVSLFDAESLGSIVDDDKRKAFFFVCDRALND